MARLPTIRQESWEYFTGLHYTSEEGEHGICSDAFEDLKDELTKALTNNDASTFKEKAQLLNELATIIEGFQKQTSDDEIRDLVREYYKDAKPTNLNRLFGHPIESDIPDILQFILDTDYVPKTKPRKNDKGTSMPAKTIRAALVRLSKEMFSNQFKVEETD